MADARAWMPTPTGVRLRVRIQPKSSRDGIDGVTVTADGPAVTARVRAIPEDGKANAALERLVAAWLGLPRSAVAVRSGQTSRVKLLAIEGSDLGARVEDLILKLQGVPE